MAAAAAEHSSSFVNPQTSIGSSGSSTSINKQSTQLPHLTDSNDNSYLYNNLFQYSNVYNSNKSSIMDNIKLADNLVLSNAPASTIAGAAAASSVASSSGSINSWFINALTQYSLANKNATNEQQSSFCY
jgi:hypothetical protein